MSSQGGAVRKFRYLLLYIPVHTSQDVYHSVDGSDGVCATSSEQGFGPQSQTEGNGRISLSQGLGVTERNPFFHSLELVQFIFLTDAGCFYLLASTPSLKAGVPSLNKGAINVTFINN